MSERTSCPVCKSKYGASFSERPHDGLSSWFVCGVCGQFIVTGSLLAEWSANEEARLPVIRRAALSHFLRKNWDETRKPAFLRSDWFEQFEKTAALLTPPQISQNLLRLLGDAEKRSGRGLVRADMKLFYAKAGAVSPKALDLVISELLDRNLTKLSGGLELQLTFDGWERYEAERRGTTTGRYGFLALKFNDEVLDPYLRDHVKPAVKTQLNFDLADMRDSARAGLIDNIMRERIRDATFVLVDLTHENAGAYWEAGYAEGLGKPVLYMCERSKFEQFKTHFDTNHLTTILWEQENPSEFIGQLVATIRRSLNLFPAA